jgi:hypothetical protein
MNEYKKLFRELRYEVWKVAFLNAFLNSAIAFFLFNVIFTIIRWPYMYSVVPALLVFLWSFLRTARRYNLRRIEEGNPEVAEILRTAHDNSSRDTLMVHALFLELMQKMETVSAGVFISAKATLLKVTTIAVLATLPLLITGFMPFLIMDNPLPGVQDSIRGVFSNDPLAPTTPIDDAAERDIYGNRDVMSLGNQRLDITAASSGGEPDFSQTDDATGRRFRFNDYPLDVSAEQTESCPTCSVDPSNAELINSYSNMTRQ